MTAYRRKDPFAATRNEMRRERMERTRANMTPEQVEAAMKKIIRAKLDDDQPIDQADFRLANLPMDQVNGLFKRVLKSVQNQRALDRK